jgi:hypothetical protein
MLGHRYRFAADGRVMRWHCTRGCDAGGEKTYATAEEAERYAAALDRGGDPDAGGAPPLLGALPVWLWRRSRRHRKDRVS